MVIRGTGPENPRAQTTYMEDEESGTQALSKSFRKRSGGFEQARREYGGARMKTGRRITNGKFSHRRGPLWRVVPCKTRKVILNAKATKIKGGARGRGRCDRSYWGVYSCNLSTGCFAMKSVGSKEMEITRLRRIIRRNSTRINPTHLFAMAIPSNWARRQPHRRGSKWPEKKIARRQRLPREKQKHHANQGAKRFRTARTKLGGHTCLISGSQ